MRTWGQKSTRALKQRARYWRNRFATDAWGPGGRSRTARGLLRRNAPLKLEMIGDSRTLLIAFGGMRGGFGMPLFEFSTLTENMPAKRLFVRDLRQAWYHQGVPQHGGTLLEFAESLRQLIAGYDVDRLVATGNSAGGYAALVYGTLLGADTVLAFAPQTVIELEVLAEMNDHGWDDRLEPLGAAGVLDRRWTDLRRALPTARRADTRHEIYFGNSHREDRLHAERLDGLDGVHLFPVEAARHNVAREMRDSGALERALRRALEAPQPASERPETTGRSLGSDPLGRDAEHQARVSR